MTNNTNPLNGYIHTIALASASHPRVLTEIMEGNINRARIALRGRIEMTLTDDELPEGPVKQAADLMNNMPGPLLRSSINEVVNALIPN